MARFPDAVWRPIPEDKTQPLVRIDQVILHVAASNGDSLFNWWNFPDNNLESHFYVRKTGVVEQYIDTARSADANLTANRRPDGSGAMSIETEGLANEQWTDAQLASILALIRWAHEVHDVPIHVCSTADDPGIGWHVMFGAPGPWTPAVGKVCPGPLRVVQFNEKIMPALAGEEDDVALSDDDKKWLKKTIGDAVFMLMFGDDRDASKPDAQHPDNLQSLRGEIKSLREDVAALKPAA